MRSFALSPVVWLLFTAETGAVSIPRVSDALQNILKNTDGNQAYRYPTDFTREIVPVCVFFFVGSLEMGEVGRGWREKRI